MVDYLSTKNASETIETLSRKLERSRILNDLKELTKKYEALCDEDKTN